MNLFEESARIKNLMRIDEQTSLDTFLQEFISGNFDKLKEFLSSNSEFTDKLKTILHTDSLESTEQSLLTANKTNLMKGMTDAKLAKDMDLYKFLDVFLKNAKNIS
jgi:hypothetical protein